MKETVVETPLIGSGSQEEADNRVRILLDLGTSRGYLTYEELNTKLPDEVVSPDKLDSLLMMIDEMGIRLIDEADIADYQAKPRGKQQSLKHAPPEVIIDDEGEEIDLNLEKELAEASTKRIDDPVRMYLTQMGEIPLLTREQEIALAKKIEITRKIFRSKVLESDYCLQSAVEILQQVDDGDLPFDRTMKISTAEDQADKGTIGQRIPTNLNSCRTMLLRNRDEWGQLREMKKQHQDDLMLASFFISGVTLLVRSESSSSNFTLRRRRRRMAMCSSSSLALPALRRASQSSRLRTSMARTLPRLSGMRWPIVPLSA